jgi:hypothetical protein
MAVFFTAEDKYDLKELLGNVSAFESQKSLFGET